MSARGPTRRKVLRLIAAGAAASRVPSAYAETSVTRWQGLAFGAEASLVIRDPDRASAGRALRYCVAEIARIERAMDPPRV